MELYIYVNNEAKRVEMFQDEKVSVTSSIQNYSDIGKLFTDYSQSFTIPASPTNNAIFSHWYDNAVDNGYDARIRYNAFIEIDTIPFREGNVQLEKANKKNGYIESYTLTFYGNLTQLKDKFGEDKLNSLDFSALNHTLSGTEIINRISNDGYDVCYPLIGNTRKFEYNTASTLDVTTTTGKIQWNDLFPAIPVAKILNYIQDKYNISFTGSFLTYQQFTKLYLYLKNMELPRAYGDGLFFDKYRITGTATFPEYNDTTDVITTDWNSSYFRNSGPPNFIVAGNKQIIIKFRVEPNGIYTTTNYKVELYQDDVILTTFDNLTGITDNFLLNIRQADDPNSHQYKIKVSAIGAFDFKARVAYIRRNGLGDRTTDAYNYLVGGAGQSFSAVQNLVNYVPDITVSDFFMGLVKMFNLIVTPINETTFKLQPLELYYQEGQIKDITKYIYSDELDIEKPKLFKTIDFRYEKSENILNNKFRELFNRDYGDLLYNSQSINESSKYEIKLPFEDVMWERTTGSDFITATLFNKDLQTYTPKPMLIYRNALTDINPKIKIYNGSTTVDVSKYIRFNNEVPIGGTDLGYVYSLNWGAEVSSWFLSIAPNGLYKRFYEQYIANLYNIKTRVIKCKGRLPSKLLGNGQANDINELVNLKLNDRIIIRDNRYIINSFTSDLTTNEVSFELINDYRALGYNSIGYKVSNIDLLKVDKNAQDIQIDLYLGMFKEYTIPASGSAFVTWSKSGLYSDDTDLTISIASNGTAAERSFDLDIDFEDYEGNTITKTINIIQEA